MPGAEDLLARLRLSTGLRIKVQGHLTAEVKGGMLDIDTLRQRLTNLATQGEYEDALLVLQMEGGMLYPYTREAMN